ncbi:MAG: glycosyltransferase family 2 protein, partial [Acidobacteriota bacterium]
GQPEPYGYGKTVSLPTLLSRRLPKERVLSDMFRVGWVSAAAMLVRRQVFQMLDGFDPDFFMYWEDVDFCYRARLAGVNVAVVPKARAIHQRGHSSSLTRQKTTWYDQSADRYFRKHYSKPVWLFHRLLRTIYRFWQPQVW